MAVTSVKVLSLPGTAEFGPSDSLSIVLLVRCDDPADGPYTVEAAAGNPSPGPDIIPTRGSDYNWGNDTSTAAQCESLSIEPNRSRSTPDNTDEFIEYIVTANYVRTNDEPGGDGGRGRDGKLANDPGKVQPKITPGYRIINQPVAQGYFVEYLDQDGNQFTPVTSGTPNGIPPVTPGRYANVQSSSYEQFLPLREISIGVPTVTCSMYYRTWNNAWDNVIQCVNNANYTIGFSDGSGQVIYNRTFFFHELLLNQISATFTQYGNQCWFYCSFEFWINEGGWYDTFLDEGTRQLGTFTSTGPEWMPNTATRGGAITAPILLDGTGRPISDGHQSGKEAVYLKFRLREEADFSTLGLIT